MAEEEGGVQVAVRVRIFNGREKSAPDNQLIIRMVNEEVGSKTFITNPDTQDEKEFKFDYSFNTHKDDPAVGPYASQDTVFNDLGKPVLRAAMTGLDVCLFAYGQTGAGKSFSMLGKQDPPELQGIIPRSCREIFRVIDQDKDDPLITSFVGIGCIEVYCEQINDLLADRKTWPPNGHKPRLTKDGHQVDNIVKPCFNYDDISSAFNFADKNRSVGSHALNPESSRAHTIYQITFERKKKTSVDAKQCETTTARINLVDLAGSERMESAGTSGQMLKEGNAINLSLTALGNTIKCLSEGKRAQFRESKLTLMLQQSMTKGKVIMIAAVSPSSICFDESMSTLRFAERIKMVKIKAKKNVTVDPVAEIKKEMEAMREAMQAEIDELRKGGGGGGGGGGGEVNTEEMEALKAALQEQKDAEEALKLDFERRLKEMNESESEKQARADEINAGWNKALGGATTQNKADIKEPHLLNLNEDQRLAETLIYKVDKDNMRVGRANKESPPDLEFNGMGILKDHCVIEKTDSKVTLIPGKGARCCVNGVPVTAATELKHNNRVWLGNNYGFRFAFPGKEDDGEKFDEAPDFFILAEEEISKHANASSGGEGGSAINHQLSDALKKVEQANIISGDLSKECLFQPKIIKNRATNEEVVVVYVSLPSGDLVWPWDKFNVRLTDMVKSWQEWQYCVSNDKEFVMAEEGNPFVDNEHQLVGEADVWLQALGNMIELEVDPAVLSVIGAQEGKMRIKIDPLDKNGEEGPWEDDREDLDPFVDDVEELKGKEVQFCVKVPKVTYEVDLSAGGKPKYSNTFIRYKFNDRDPDEDWSRSDEDTGNGIEANFNHQKKFKVLVTSEVANHFMKGKMTFQIWGKVAAKAGEDQHLLPAGWKRVNAFQAPDGSLHLHAPNKDGTPSEKKE